MTTLALQNPGTRQLLKTDADVERESRKASVLRSFLLMSAGVSLNHGTVVSCISFAPTYFGKLEGNLSSAVLWGTYTLSALLGSSTIVDRIGYRTSLLGALLIYVLYVLAFYVATLFDAESTAQTIVVIIGASLGGFAAGFLWVAQGAFFGKAAQNYASASASNGEEPNKKAASTYFAGLFATILLGLELITKVLATLLMKFAHFQYYQVVIVYTILALLGVGLTYLAESPESANQQGITESMVILAQHENDLKRKEKSFFSKVFAAVILLFSDAKISMLIPTWALFGFAATLVNSYFTPNFVAKQVGKDYIGSYSAIISGSASLFSYLIAYLTRVTGLGKTLGIFFGNTCMALMGAFIFYMQSANKRCLSTNYINATVNGTCTSPAVMTIPYLLQGAGRSTYESTMSAVLADFYPNNGPGAFANKILFAGLFSATSYSFEVAGIFKSGVILNGLVLGIGFVSLATFVVALRLNKASASRLP
eukprot:g754.t1